MLAQLIGNLLWTIYSLLFSPGRIFFCPEIPSKIHLAILVKPSAF